MENGSHERGESLRSSLNIQRLQWRLVLGLIAITLLTFLSSCWNGFVQYDDSVNIYGNPHIQSLSLENLKWMFTDTSFAQRYMPLGWLSYALDYHFFGANPMSYHAGNLVLHLVNVVLLFFLLKRLLLLTAERIEESKTARRAVWCAAVGTLFWAVNPLRTEPVGWASARPYCLMFLLTMTSLLAWLQARTSTVPGWRRTGCYVISVVAYAASLVTYPLALFLPVALVVLDAYRLRRSGTRVLEWAKVEAWRILKDKIPFLLVAASMVAISLLARVATDLSHRPTTLSEFSLFSRLMQALYVWSYYVWKPWFPYDLAVCYPTLHSFDPLTTRFVLSAICVLALTFVALKLRQRWPALLTLWLCHLALLVPVLGLTEYPHSACDRYSYLHGVLWSVAIAALLVGLWRRGRTGHLVAITVSAASLVFALSAWQQIATWNNPMSFYRQVITVHGEHPHRARFDEALARNYLTRGLTNEAIGSLENAIRYESHRADRHIYGKALLPYVETELGDVLAAQGSTEQALAHYRAALQNNSDLAEVRIKMGTALAQLNQDAAAIDCFREVLQSRPNQPRVHHELALLLRKTGQEAEAIQHLQQERTLMSRQ